MDIASLVIKIDARDVAKGRDELGRFTKAGQDAEQKVTRSANKMGSAFGGLGGYIQGALGVAAIRTIIKAADAAQQLQGRLKLVTDSAADLKRVNDALFASSQRTGTGFAANANLYIKLATVSAELGKSQSQLLKFTESVGNALTLSGASAESASGALLQLSQAIGGGIVRAEEFNSILEGAPVIIQTVARNLEAAGGSVSTLRRLVNDGKVSSVAFFDAFERGGGKLAASVAQLPRTVSRAATELENEFNRILQSSDLSPVIEGLDGLKAALSDPTIIKGLGDLIKGMVAATGFALKLAAAIGDVAKYLGEYAAEAALNAQGSSGTLAGQLQKANQEVGYLKGNIADMKSFSLDTTNAQKELVDLEARVKSLKSALYDQQKIQNAEVFGGVFKDFNRQIDEVAQGPAASVVPMIFRELGEAAGKAAPVVDAVGKAIQKANESATEQIAVMKRQIELINGGTLADEAATRAQMEANGVRKASIDTYIETQRHLKLIEIAAQDAADQLSDMQGKIDAIQALKDQFEPAAEVIARFNDGLAKLSVFGPASEQSVKDFAASLGYDLVGSVGDGDAALKEYRNTIIGLQALKLDPALFDQLSQRALEKLDGVRTGAEETGTAIETFLGKNVGADLAVGFDKASQSLGAFVNVFQGLISSQEEYIAAIAEAKQKGESTAKIEQRNQMNQLRGYGDLTGAAKGFFKKGSDGYKALGAAEKAFRAIEFAMAVKSVLVNATSVASKIAANSALSISNAIAAISGAAIGAGPAGFITGGLMAAAMAGLGIATGAFGGGGGGSKGQSAAERQAAQGTGSVLGDAKAQNEGLLNALKALEALSKTDLQVSSAMLQALRNIESALTGVTNGLFRANAGTGGGATPFNIETTRTSNLGGGAGDRAAAAAVGSALGAGIGAWFGGPFGAIIGANIGSVVGAFASKIPVLGGIVNGITGGLFGSTKIKQIDSGIQFAGETFGNILADGLSGTYYATLEKTKKSVFGLNKSVSTSEVTQALQSAVQTQFSGLLSNIGTSIIGAIDLLGLDAAAAQEKLNNFVISLGKISLEGLSAEDAQKAISAVFGNVADQMVTELLPAITDFQRVGEGLFETLLRVSSETNAVTSFFDQIGKSFIQTGLEAAETVQALADAAGGFDVLQSALSFFYQNFYSEGERTAILTGQLVSAFGDLGQTLPESEQAYRALVNSIDISSDAGRKLYSSLLSLGPAFANVSQSIAQLAAQSSQLDIRLATATGDTAGALSLTRAAELAATDPSLHPKLQAIYAAEDAEKAAADAAAAQQAAAQKQAAAAAKQQAAAQKNAEAAKKNRDVAESLRDYVRGLGQDPNIVGESAAFVAAQDNLIRLAGLAKNKDAAAAGQLTGAAGDFLTLKAGLATSREDVRRAQGMVSSLLLGVANVFDPAIETEKNTRAIRDGGDRREKVARDTLAAVERLRNDSVVERQVSKDVAANDPVIVAVEREARVRKFAMGGDFGGGLRIVGENGPELEATGPSRIFNANQTRSMMSGDGSAEDMKAMRAELKQAMYQVAKNTGEMARFLRAWDDGDRMNVNILQDAGDRVITQVAA